MVNGELCLLNGEKTVRWDTFDARVIGSVEKGRVRGPILGVFTHLGVWNPTNSNPLLNFFV
jgi:hypothetical protein